MSESVETIIREEIGRDRDYLVSLRRYFHQHPETAREEFNTAKRIESELESFGLKTERVGETGVYAEIKGTAKGPAKTIVLRADIDALPVTEKHESPYKSQNEGKMHACGHDSHTAGLLGAAKYLAKHTDLFPGTVRLTFQAGEEIGTMTWYDPASGRFGALGHAVSDMDTGVLLPMRSGIVGRADVDSIVRGSAGQPGELKGNMGLDNPFGSILENREAGIFGVLEPGALPEVLEEPVELCPLGELRCGPAEIVSDVSGSRERYSARILRVYTGDGSRDLLIQVTDERLIRLTGGIVQGMSGSPILQDGRLAGAVTHVLVSDPTKGYGISIEDMLEERERTVENAA